MSRGQSATTTAAGWRLATSVLWRASVVFVLTGVFASWATWRMVSAVQAHEVREGTGDRQGAATATDEEPEIAFWTCSMHPEVRQPEPGDCPICGMELIPKYTDEAREPDEGSPVASGRSASARGEQPSTAPDASQARAWYRCTMPECGDVGSPDPDSRCPVCGMKREPVEMGDPGAGAAELALGERAQRLAEIATEPVAEHLLHRQIRTVGRVGYDETRYKMVSAWIGGRIDKLFADFTGMNVQQGDHLVELYSPELMSAQEEYLQALRAAQSVSDAAGAVTRRSTDQVLRSARRKLELLGLTDAQIAAIEGSQAPSTRFVVHAPLGGTIVEKHAMEGMYVDTGDRLYTIADLTHLWVLVDLYEADLPWVKPFQEVAVTTRSLPGEVFTGQIVFIEPRVDPQTRTVAVRIHVSNPELRLKPDMWVTAEIDAALGRDARVAVPAPGGAYACPMHPWETADGPGACPICEMRLVAAEDLPQYTPPTDAAPLLSVPRSAVMQTGERALVYIERRPGTYVGVEVTLGPLAHDAGGREFYPVLSGLAGGERVVTRGAFAIDSQMQLAGKPSLFQARGMGGGAHEHEAGAAPPDAAAGDTGAGTRSEVSSDAEKPVAGDKASAPTEIAQTTCPVMGGAINPEVSIEYEGVTVYFCCPPCVADFRAEPEKYVGNLPAAVRARLSETIGAESDDD